MSLGTTELGCIHDKKQFLIGTAKFMLGNATTFLTYCELDETTTCNHIRYTLPTNCTGNLPPLSSLNYGVLQVL